MNATLMYSEIQYYFFDDVYSIQGQANRPLDRSMGYTFDFSEILHNAPIIPIAKPKAIAIKDNLTVTIAPLRNKPKLSQTTEKSKV